MFKKSKPTFLSQAGRNGAPSARKPMVAKKVISSAKKPAGKSITGTTSIKNGRPATTGAMKGAMNSYRTSKAVSHKTLSRPMAKGPVLKSVTKSPQSTPMSYRPKG